MTFADTPLYENGAVVGDVHDCYVSGEAREKYKADVTARIGLLLAYPATASYPDDSRWHFSVTDGQDVCRASVTSDNTFGNRVNMDFEIKYERAARRRRSSSTERSTSRNKDANKKRQMPFFICNISAG